MLNISRRFYRKYCVEYIEEVLSKILCWRYRGAFIENIVLNISRRFYQKYCVEYIEEVLSKILC